METKILKDSEILEKICFDLRISKNKIAKDCGYKSAETIYKIIRGEGVITNDMCLRISAVYPEINYKFIKYGSGNVLKEKSKQQIEDEAYRPYVQQEMLAEINNRLQKIEEEQKNSKDILLNIKLLLLK